MLTPWRSLTGRVPEHRAAPCRVARPVCNAPNRPAAAVWAYCTPRYGVDVNRSYLVVLGDREAIRWVLCERRMAFPATPRAEVYALAPGDWLYLYATRGAWRNPTRDRGRIIGLARAAGAAKRFETPVEVAGRSFFSGCDLAYEGVVPYPGGVELQPLVSRLTAFPKPHAWSVYLRRPLLSLSKLDAALLKARLRPLLTRWESALPTYPVSPSVHQDPSNLSADQ